MVFAPGKARRPHNRKVTIPDDAVARPTAHYPPANITPAEFEEFATSLFATLEQTGAITDLRIQNHERIHGPDGTYDFDATARFGAGGMHFLVLVEAKLHTNPIKREAVQVLHQKLQSVGANKAVLISSAPFQKGALDFAIAHGIALVTVTEGRFTYEVRHRGGSAPVTREEEAENLGLPPFVGHAYSAGDSTGSVCVDLLSPDYPDHIAQHLVPSVD